MNWKSVRWILIIIFALLNLVLFGYGRVINRQMYEVPEARMLDLKARFADWGYALPEQLSSTHYPAAELILQESDLESRADQYWDTDYEKSYMVDARMLYTCGTETLTVDRDHSNMVYTQNRPAYDFSLDKEQWETKALETARKMTKVEDLTRIRRVKTTGDTIVYTFCERYDGQLLFANQTVVTVTNGAVVRASMTQYKIQGYETRKLNQYPVDEMLYSGLKQLGPAAEGRSTPESLEVFFGYQIHSIEEDGIYCVPMVAVIREDGSGLRINRFTDTSTVLS
ncbi:MAG: hypothetical protein IJ917_04605 [Firmicutes bacterium]|nr:hypothetical protein [Bacillota bacterium]